MKKLILLGALAVTCLLPASQANAACSVRGQILARQRARVVVVERGARAFVVQRQAKVFVVQQQRRASLGQRLAALLFGF